MEHVASPVSAQVLRKAAVSTGDINILLAREDQIPVLSDMMPDLRRVAQIISAKYTDITCYALSAEDLEAECMKKLSELVTKGWLTRVKNRGEFFKVAKTCMNNHVMGLVQHHRFTIKRTGRKAPEKGSVTDEPTSFKPDISIDDPENGIQLDSHADQSTDDRECTEDFKQYLSPVEKLVLDQLTAPDGASLMFAYIDSCRGRSKGSDVNVKVRIHHMAEATGLPLDTFSKIQQSIQVKFKKFMANPNEDLKFNAALATLELTFGVQVPRSQSRPTIARLFTIAARDQYEKVTLDVSKMLTIVGAKPPSVDDSERLSCFGVLFQKNHRVCSTCGLKSACQVESANYGLGEINISPKLLGARMQRTAHLTDQPTTEMEDTSTTTETPAVASSSSSNSTTVTHTERDEGVLNYLREHFKPLKFGTDLYYTHKSGKPKCIFYVGKDGEPMHLRFCKPSEELKALLHREVRSYYLRPETTLEEAIKLLESHADSTFKA